MKWPICLLRGHVEKFGPPRYEKAYTVADSHCARCFKDFGVKTFTNAEWQCLDPLWAVKRLRGALTVLLDDCGIPLTHEVAFQRAVRNAKLALQQTVETIQ